jgi:hypothetical protein
MHFPCVFHDFLANTAAAGAGASIVGGSRRPPLRALYVPPSLLLGPPRLLRAILMNDPIQSLSPCACRHALYPITSTGQYNRPLSFCLVR